MLSCKRRAKTVCVVIYGPRSPRISVYTNEIYGRGIRISRIPYTTTQEIEAISIDLADVIKSTTKRALINRSKSVELKDRG